jgi:hypothetical protein
MVAAGVTRPLATGARSVRTEKEIEMDRLSFGDGAGHLMERLLEHAGITEVAADTVLVQPEADGVVRELLEVAAGGRWIVGLRRDAGHTVDVKLSEVDGQGLRGMETDADGNVLDRPVRRLWHTIDVLHIY